MHPYPYITSEDTKTQGDSVICFILISLEVVEARIKNPNFVGFLNLYPPSPNGPSGINSPLRELEQE